jgi:hypothetical protein
VDSLHGERVVASRLQEHYKRVAIDLRLMSFEQQRSELCYALRSIRPPRSRGGRGSGAPGLPLCAALAADTASSSWRVTPAPRRGS